MPHPPTAWLLLVAAAGIRPCHSFVPPALPPRSLRLFQAPQTPEEAPSAAPAAGAGSPEPKVSQEALAAIQEELTSPFRGLRFFAYGAGFLGGGLGFVTAATQVAAGLGEAANAPPLGQSVKNVAIDFAVVAASVAGWVWDSRQKDAKVTALKEAQKRKTGNANPAAAEEKMDMLGKLEVVISVDSAVAPEGAAGLKAKLDDILGPANQGVVVLATDNPDIVEESLVRAQILGAAEFAAKDVLVVPVDITALRRALKKGVSSGEAGKKGFGAAPASPVWLEEGYVAPPAPGSEAAWLKYVERELADAETQGASNAANQGVAICVKRGKVVARRGLGVPKWEDVLRELTSSG